MGCEFSDKVREFKRDMIQEFVDQFSDKNLEGFKRMYGEVKNIPEDEMWKVYYQCKRTAKSKR